MVLPTNFRPSPNLKLPAGGGIPRAQNFRDNAKVSASQFNRPTTSISRQAVSTSIPGFDDNKHDEAYNNYSRRLVSERQAKEEKEMTVKSSTSAPSKYNIGVGTGASFSRKIRGGFNKTFNKMVRKSRATYGNISANDKKFLGDLIQKHAVNRTTGTGFGLSAKKSMKMEVEKNRQQGKISSEDSRDFKKIINELH